MKGQTGNTKDGREAIEVVIAAKNKNREKVIYESADLLYHLLVLFSINDIKLTEIVSKPFIKVRTRISFVFIYFYFILKPVLKKYLS